jgi:hypothetical protein
LEATVKGHLVVTGIARVTEPVLVAVAWACLGAAGAPAGESQQRVPATHDLPALREGVRQARLRLRDLLVEYLLNTCDPGGEMSKHTVRNVLATRGLQRYIRLTHFNDRVPEELDFTENEGFFTGKTFDVFYRRSLYYETMKQTPEQTESWKLRGDFFLECLGWWPPEDTSRPPQGEQPFYLHQALDAPGYGVLPFQEEQGGALCHVVERPGVDRLWIDPGIGFALRGRLRFAGQPPALAAGYEMSDFREAAPGIWLPWRVREIVYRGPPRPGGDGPQVEHEVVGSVVRVQVNDVPEELFHFTPPPGTLIQDRDAHKTWQVPGGLSFLDDVVTLARARLDFYRAHRQDLGRGEDATARPWRTWAMDGVVMLLGLMNLASLVWIGGRLVAGRPGSAHGQGGAELPRAAPRCC